MTLIPDPDAYSYAANFVTDQQTTNKGILGLGFFWKHLDSCSHIDRHGCTLSRGEEHSWTILSKFGATWKADGCHNWADSSQHLMLFWRSGVYCHFRATPAAVYLAATVQVILFTRASWAVQCSTYKGTIQRFLRGTGKPLQHQLVQLGPAIFSWICTLQHFFCILLSVRVVLFELILWPLPSQFA